MGQPERLPDLYSESDRVRSKEAPRGRAGYAAGGESTWTACDRRKAECPHSCRKRELRTVCLDVTGGDGRGLWQRRRGAQACKRSAKASCEAQTAGCVAGRVSEPVGEDQAEDPVSGHRGLWKTDQRRFGDLGQTQD